MRDSMSADEMKEAYKQKCLIDVDEVRKRVVRAVTEWRNERLQSFEKQQRNRFMAAHTGDEGERDAKEGLHNDQWRSGIFEQTQISALI